MKICLLLAMVALLILFVALGSTTFLAHNTIAAQWEKSTNLEAEAATNIEVLVAGASRTGTSSMEQALQKLGYHTTHWKGYMIRYFDFIFHSYQGAISDPNLHQVFQDIPGKGALLDTVVPMLFDHLRRAYPNAKVILTTRESTVWLKSYEKYVHECWLYQPSTRHPVLWMLSHVSRAFRLGSLLRYLSSQPKTGLDLDLLPELAEIYRKSDEVMYDSWIPSNFHMEKRKLYEEHVKATVPQEQLLIFDASAGDNFRKLVTFLNTSVPADLDLDTYPKVFDEQSLKTQGTHSQIVKGHPFNVVLLATAISSLILMIVVALKLASLSEFPAVEGSISVDTAPVASQKLLRLSCIRDELGCASESTSDTSESPQSFPSVNSMTSSTFRYSLIFIGSQHTTPTFFSLCAPAKNKRISHDSFQHD